MGDKRLITPEDLAEIIYVDDPQCSPDGHWIAYVHQQPSLSENAYLSNIYLVASNGGKPVRLTYGNKDTQPRWSPNGKHLAFVSSRGGKPQIYLLPVFDIGGEARQLTQHINGATSPVWSPDGQQIAFTGKINAAERADEQSNNSHLASSNEPQTHFDPLVIDRIPYREGTTVLDGRFTQIYVADVVSAEVRRVSTLETHYTAPEWSRDSRRLYTIHAVDVNADEYNRYGNIYELDVETGQERALLNGKYTLSELTLSPDGQYLAFNQREGRDTASNFDCCLLTLATGEVRSLNADLDRPMTMPRWMNANALIACVATEGRSVIYEFAPDGSHSVIVNVGQQVVGLCVSPNGLIVTSSATMENPSELVAWQGHQRQPLTRVNDDFLASRQVQPVHELWFESPGGRVQGWYLLPAGYEEGQQYPLAVNIHGGPQYMWSSHERSLWHEWQSHAADGYVVFFCNPRGSEGYGNVFNHGLDLNWGELAMQDIMAGVDAMLSMGLIDPERMVITGGSFGGFMTAWIVAHDQRFKAAVAQRGVYNLISFYSTTDIPTFAESQFDRLPWNDHDYLWAQSPLKYAANIETPMLIIHSENDFRVAIEQAEQLYAWLHRMGKTVRFVRFPRDGHEMTRSGEPQHRLRSLQEMMNWWNRFITK